MLSSVLFCKEEPVSPLTFDEESSQLSDDNTLFYQTSPFDEEYDIKFDADLLACESKAEVASHILENLENLMNLDDLIKEEEPFLLDEKILPILDEVEAPRAVPVPNQNVKMEYFNKSSTSETQLLLNEFQTVYDVVEFTNTLTPPQSPPSNQQPMFTTLEPLLAPHYHHPQPQSQPQQAIIPDVKQTAIYQTPVPEKQLVPNGLGFRIATTTPLAPASPAISLDYQQVATPQTSDIAHELAVVDELVRKRIDDMQWNNFVPSSPNSSSSCSSSNFGDCMSDDPEWIPESTVEGPAESLTSTPKSTNKKRSKPYSRGQNEDKKSRKKEQNKNAATRYRLKKKAEVEEILTEEKILLDHNVKLNGEISELQREIKYLKGLMRDLFKAKGLID